MSKDSSSSKTAKSTVPLKRDYPRAIGVIAATTAVFLSAQIVGVLLVFVVLGLLGYDSQSIQDMAENSVYLQFFAALSVQAITLLSVYLLLWHKKYRFWSFFGLQHRPKKEHLGLAIVGYVLYVTVFIFVLPVLSFILPFVDPNQTQQLGFDSPAGWELVAVFATLVLLPAFVEEVVFRGILFRGLKKYLGVVAALVLSSVLFGMAHLEFLSDGPPNFVAAIDTTLLGVVLTAISIRAQSLWPAIFLHAIKNSIAFVVLFVI